MVETTTLREASVPDRVETWRLFVATYPPPKVALAMLEEANRLRVPGRAPSVDHVHMTLLFMGDRPATGVPAIEHATRNAASGIGPVTITPKELVTLPPHRPRLLVLACEASPNLRTLYARLVGLLTRPGDRGVRHTLLPHFTLRRFGRDDRVPPIASPVRFQPIECREIVLMRSELGKGDRGCAVHTPCARVPLQ